MKQKGIPALGAVCPVVDGARAKSGGVENKTPVKDQDIQKQDTEPKSIEFGFVKLSYSKSSERCIVLQFKSGAEFFVVNASDLSSVDFDKADEESEAYCILNDGDTAKVSFDSEGDVADIEYGLDHSW